jgi:hypothetical protein
MSNLVGENLEICPDNVPALFCVRKKIEVSKKKLGNRIILNLLGYHIHFSVKPINNEFHIKGYFYHRKIYDKYVPLYFFEINNSNEIYDLDGKYILSKILKWIYPFHEFYL